MFKIMVVSPCFNEEDNVLLLYQSVKEVFSQLGEYSYEHIFIDNASQDKTPDILRSIAIEDRKVKVIFNSRNFGHIRSPYYALLQSTADATILMASDLQDPPSLIPELLALWRKGFKTVKAVKESSEESPSMFALRRFYYFFVNRLSEVELTKNFTGFGLYDRVIIENLRKIDDSYPYFRGLISEIGFESTKVYYRQPSRRRGITSNNFYSLYDIAMLGLTNHSKVPLRFATLLGFTMSVLGLIGALCYFILKLIFWNQFSMGLAPLIITLFTFSSVQLFFIGVIGEYIGSIYTHIRRRPLVIEKERINFDEFPTENLPSNDLNTNIARNHARV
jgi:glycosyltransferase involved in cell wall biosynthesis